MLSSVYNFLAAISHLHDTLQEDRENILRARATGKAVLTSPFRLLGSHHLGVVLTFPVYKSKLPPKPTMEERIKATAGYVLLVNSFWLVKFVFTNIFVACLVAHTSGD